MAIKSNISIPNILLGMLILIISILPQFSGAATNHGGSSGWSSATAVDVSLGDGTHVFQKQKGTGTLFVTEVSGAFASPFSGATIVVNIISGQTGSYTVNGTLYSSGHPLWASGTIAYWIQLPTDPVGVMAPNLALNIANTSAVTTKQYLYDPEDPIGTYIRIYDMDLGSSGTQITLTGQWTGKNVASEVECNDLGVSGCRYDRDIKRPIYNHYSGASFYLEDNALNQTNGEIAFIAGLVDSTDTPINSIPEIFVDRISPMEDEVTFQGVHLDSTNTGYFFATGSTGSTFHLKLYDPAETANFGVSGIYSYELTALHIQNHTGSINLITCDLSGTVAPYNLSGTLTNQDDEDIELSCLNLWREGDYIISYTGYDYVGNSVSGKFPIHISPSNTLGIIDIDTIDKNTKYANNFDSYIYSVTIKDIHGNPIYNKPINFINQEQSGSIGPFLTIQRNMVTTPISGDDAIIENYITSTLTNDDGEYSFTLKSFAPGIFTEIFKVILPVWDDHYINDTSLTQTRFMTTGMDNSFLKPFTGILSIHNDTFRVGTVQQLDLILSNIACTSLLCGPSYTIDNYSNSLTSSLDYNFSVNRNEDHVNDGTIDTITFPTVDIALNYIGSTSAGTGNPGIDTHPYITYDVGGAAVSYFISTTSSGGDNTPLGMSGATFYGTKVIGTIEGIGKQQLTGQDANFTDFTKSTLRDGIKKNIGILTRSMTSGQKANSIYYIEGDITINGTLDYETLIVKDGNVIIDGDLNVSGEKLGIIVTRSNSTNTGVANIYVTPNVRYIDASIYADGSLRSADTSGAEYPADSPTRTIDLRNQLFLLGSLFTKNTIGGAIGDAGTYILPGGYKTSNFDEAVQYDLNYIRTGNTGWNLISPAGVEFLDKDEDYSFILMYNPEIQTNPPKGFSYK